MINQWLMFKIQYEPKRLWGWPGVIGRIMGCSPP